MPTHPIRSLGFIEQDPDPRDITFGGVPALPGASGDVDLRQWCSPIENQGNINSCVGNATCSALEMLRIKQNLRHVDLSRLFTYYCARDMRGDSKRDIGSVIRFAFATLNTIGSCVEAVWAYNTTKVLVRPPLLAYRNALSSRISKYEAIKGTGKPRIEACINALRGGYPVVYGMNVTDGFMYLQGGQAKFTGKAVGAHCMMLCGYLQSKNQFIVRNSWGTGWGERGYCYMDVGYLDQMSSMDFWVPKEVPSNIK